MKYKSKSLRNRRGTSKWELCLTHKDPLSGEDVPTYHTIEAKTRRQAERARDELIVQLEMEGFAVTSNMTILQFMESFLDYKVASKTIEPSTIRGYRADTRMICKYIGSERLADLNVPMVNAWMARMSEDYAPKSINKCFRLLKQAINYAIAQDLMVKNPCNFCKPPKRVKTPINALPRAERSRMLDIARRAQPSPLAVAIELALTTGMRRGEICALRWSDFNEENHTISVTHALGSGEGGFYLKEPKTPGSERTIPLTSHTFELLKGMRDDSAWMLKRLKVPVGDAFILGTQVPEFRPYNPSILTKEYAAFCKMNGFECTFHDLRHTFATYMIGNGTDVRTVASYLGHSSASMTLDIYADVDPEAKLAAVNKIEESFDDSYSVFKRESEERRREFESEKRTSEHRELLEAGSMLDMPHLSASSIPFTIEELQAMIAVLQNDSTAA